jgi:site-specific recombinase XerD
MARLTGQNMKGLTKMNRLPTTPFDPESTISHLISKLDEMGYSKDTIGRLNSVWRNFAAYWEMGSHEEFSLQVISEYMSFRYGCRLGDRGASHNVVRAMCMLWDYSCYGRIFKQSYINRRGFCPKYRDAFNGFMEFLEHSGYSDGSLRTLRSQMFQFEEFLRNSDIPSIAAVTPENLQRYTETLKRFAPRTIERNLRMLKQFFDYCHKHGYTTKQLSPSVPKIRIHRDINLPTTFTQEETAALLSAVDRSNALGKRDYAILAMAALLGLRISDIIGLTFDEIDWTKRTLSIAQQKTGKLVELPLSDEVGWAIIDYLQNGRPQSSCQHVFIKHCAPYDELAPSMSRTLKKYLRRAHIETPAGKPVGMHAFRHSLASAMLERGVSLPVISGTLGHSDPHSTETYLRLDIAQLRMCALEVDV